MRILHVFRAPIGGLYRHVCDLVRGQTAMGHDVGIICDSSTGGEAAARSLENIAPLCKLGIIRRPMSTKPSSADLSTITFVRQLATELKVDLIHGHGAKGGLYARLASVFSSRRSVYTPHGGSLHFYWTGFPGILYLGTEWVLRHLTDGLAFVCEFERDVFAKKIGLGSCQVGVVYNGLWAHEFKTIPDNIDACDLLFVGEMAHRKGVDVMLRAIASLKPEKCLSAAMVGDGPDIEAYKALSVELGLSDHVHFHGRQKIDDALPLGKLFVLPSRLESFPYVVLEALAAGKPMISTKVGGLAEVLPEALLFETENVEAMAEKLRDYYAKPNEYAKLTQKLAQEVPLRFSAVSMVQNITDFYGRLRGSAS